MVVAAVHDTAQRMIGLPILGHASLDSILRWLEENHSTILDPREREQVHTQSPFLVETVCPHEGIYGCWNRMNDLGQSKELGC